VVERASFARAASSDFSPSALSQTIRLLETRLGAVAEPHHPQRGTDGHWGAVVRAYRALFRDMTEAVAQASAAAKQTSGTLRINTLGMAARQVSAATGPFIAHTRT
jgi:DNA-binding transcriptional LysR family regulator